MIRMMTAAALLMLSATTPVQAQTTTRDATGREVYTTTRSGGTVTVCDRLGREIYSTTRTKK